MSDANAVFDDSAAFPFDTANRVEDRHTVQKSAVSDPTDPNDCLTSVFPFQSVEVQKSADGTELMNRLLGQNAEDSEPGGVPGRPRKSGKATPLADFQKSLAEGKPRSTIAIDPKGKIIGAGSVLQTLMPDGVTIRFLVLMADVPFDIIESLDSKGVE